MKDFTAKQILKAVERRGFDVFKNDTKPYNLNIIGIRSANPVVNEFNCLMAVIWHYEGQWNLFKMQMTSLPGLYWLVNPCNPLGCAILKEGQYKGVYKIDKHNGKYEAVCQRLGNVTVYRDNDRDRQYDTVQGTENTGMFGINIHRAHQDYELETVDKYSAGCQVIQDPNEFEVFMDVVRKSAEIFGNKFTYTLINENDIN